MLSVEQRGAWEKIVKQKVDIIGWMDLWGHKHNKKHGKMYKHFLTCTVFHLQTIFDEDTVEHQQIYISNHLKKHQHTHVNSYIKYLPSIYNSPKTMESTQLNVPYTEAQLAVQLLRMCPVHWQNQYDLNQNTIPQDTRQ